MSCKPSILSERLPLCVDELRFRCPTSLEVCPVHRCIISRSVCPHCLVLQSTVVGSRRGTLCGHNILLFSHDSELLEPTIRTAAKQENEIIVSLESRYSHTPASNQYILVLHAKCQRVSIQEPAAGPSVLGYPRNAYLFGNSRKTKPKTSFAL